MLRVCQDKPFMPHWPVKTIASELTWWNEHLQQGNVSQPIKPPAPFADPLAFSNASFGVGIAIVIGE